MPTKFDRNSRKDDGITFDEWIKLVDEECSNQIGLGYECLPDKGYWDEWDAGVSPKESVRELMVDNGLEDEE